MILDPGVGISDVAVEQVLPVVVVGFEIGLLDLVADELRIARREIFLDELEVARLGVLRHLLALDGLLENVHQVHRIGADLVAVEVEGLREDLVGKARRSAVHALGDAGRIAILLHGARVRVGILEVLAVVDAHLGEELRILVLLEAAQDRELREHLERAGRAGRLGELARPQQLVVDFLLLGHAQAVRHLDHADTVEEGFVGAVRTEALPLALVGVRDDDALVRHGADVLGADVGAVLRRREERVQHLQRRLEHLDELEEAL